MGRGLNRDFGSAAPELRKRTPEPQKETSARVFYLVVRVEREGDGSTTKIEAIAKPGGWLEDFALAFDPGSDGIATAVRGKFSTQLVRQAAPGFAIRRASRTFIGI